MAGFTIYISSRKIPENIRCRDKSGSEKASGFMHHTLKSDHYLFELYTNNKFPADKILSEKHDTIICNEGVILNLATLLEQYQQSDTASLIKHIYETKGKSFPDILRGDFSGFIFDKKTGECFVYTNHTGSKRVFYYQQEGTTLISSDLGEISHLLKSEERTIKLNRTAAYFLLTHGFMADNSTLIEGVKRLMPGCTMNFSLDTAPEIEQYFHLGKIERNKDSKAGIIEKMDALFNQAVVREFEKDKSCGYKHIATLSGGLDSRMTVLVADKLGYSSQLNFTFSQANYLDEKIAKQIAVDHGHDFLFESLDGGNFLKNADACTLLNDGLVLYSGSAHLLHAMQNINFEEYGLIHTGLVGDAVIGSFLSAPDIVAPAPNDGMYSVKLAGKISKTMQDIVSTYDSEEIYKFYTRGFLGAMNGNYTIDLFSQAVSPFLDVDFLSYCISIPEKYKYKQKIYLEWIAAKHPEFARYPWEKTGVSPLKSNNYKRYLDMGYYKRMSLKFFDKLSGEMKSGMNPFDHWMKTNKSLRDYVQGYFSDNIGLLNFDTALNNDCHTLFTEGNTGEKFQVLTLLAAIKLHHIEG